MIKTEPPRSASPYYHRLSNNDPPELGRTNETNCASYLACSRFRRDVLSPSLQAPGHRSQPINGHLLLPREQSDSAYSHHDHKETTSCRARLSLARDALILRAHLQTSVPNKTENLCSKLFY